MFLFNTLLLPHLDLFSKIICLVLLIIGLLALVCTVYVSITIFFKNKQIDETITFYTKKEKKISDKVNTLPLLFLKESKQSNTIFFSKIYAIFSKELKIKFFLGLIASVSPLLGLLGTIWGIANIFFSMKDSAVLGDISSIAPGISQALLTTLAGLSIAIPSLITYHILGMILKNIFHKADILYEYHSILKKDTSNE